MYSYTLCIFSILTEQKAYSALCHQKALQRAGITDYRWHDNRHTWASILIQNGVPLNEVQEMDAWNNAEMVKRYAHLAPQKLASNAQIVDQVLFGTVTILSQ